jgi:hypothetical protein
LLPLSEKVRIEVYVPDLPPHGYRSLLETLEREFSFTFGGCTIVRGLNGSYLSHAGDVVQDRVNLIYTDAPFSMRGNRDSIARYAAELKAATFKALEEEAVLVVVSTIFHPE